MTESVHHPSHYGGGDNPYEAIKVIEAWDLGFNLGNAAKYISRAGKKGDAVEDLKKAAWYVLRELANAEGLDPDVYTSAFNVWTKTAAASSSPAEAQDVSFMPGVKVVPLSSKEAIGYQPGDTPLDRGAKENVLIGIGSPDSLKSEHQLRVEAMMRGYGQTVVLSTDHLDLKDEKLRELRARLILEEAMETIQRGLKVDVFAPELGVIDFNELTFVADGPSVDMVELADGCADVSVVVTGTLSAYGIWDKPLLLEVDNNNLLKIQNGRTDPVTGKFLKPKDHPAPDIPGVLAKQGLMPKEESAS